MLNAGDHFTEDSVVVDSHESTGSLLHVFQFRTIVYTLEHVASNKRLIAKTLQPLNMEEGLGPLYPPFRLECEAAQYLGQHPNFVKLLNVIHHNETRNSYMVFEYVDGSTVGKVAVESRDYYFEDLIDWAYQLLTAMSFMKDRGVWLTDISEDNILVDQRCILRLIDYTHACHLETTKRFIDADLEPDKHMVNRTYRRIGELLLRMYNVSLVNELLAGVPEEVRQSPLGKEWLEGQLGMAQSLVQLSSIYAANSYMYSPEESDLRKELKGDVKAVIGPLLWIDRKPEIDIGDLLNRLTGVHDRLHHHECSIVSLY